MNKQLELDCYHKAEAEGQPKPFTLIASDALAPNMIRLWCRLSEGNIIGAIELFAGLVGTDAASYSFNPRRPEKIEQAEAIAAEMADWREETGLPVFNH